MNNENKLSFNRLQELLENPTLISRGEFIEIVEELLSKLGEKANLKKENHYLNESGEHLSALLLAEKDRNKKLVAEVISLKKPHLWTGKIKDSQRGLWQEGSLVICDNGDIVISYFNRRHGYGGLSSNVIPDSVKPLVETPATDAAINEIKAQVLDQYQKEFKTLIDVYKDNKDVVIFTELLMRDAEKAAAKLRKGE